MWCLYGPFLLGTSLFLLTRTFFGWLAAADAQAVLDRHAASLAWLTSAGLAHRNLLHSRVEASGGTPLSLVTADEILVLLLGKRVSEQAVQASWNIGAGASATASLACVPTWHEDFRNDLSRINVPTLVIHGDADRILPIAASGLRTAKLITGARLLVVKDGPHCITWTHAEQVNGALLEFLGKDKEALKKPKAHAR